MWCRDNAPHMEEMTSILQMQKMHPEPSSSTEVCWLAIKNVESETVGQDVVALIRGEGKRKKKK